MSSLSPISEPVKEQVFAIHFLTNGPGCPVNTLKGWLTERGEPWQFFDDEIHCRALPLRFETTGCLSANLTMHSRVPLTRVVDLIFSLSLLVGADVVLPGVGPVTRAALYLRLADEQDRQRIAEVLAAATERGSKDVAKKMWAMLGALRPDRDDRWDASSQRVVEMKEVGAGVSLEDAKRINPDVELGDEVGVPVSSLIHITLWRWMSDAYPGLTQESTAY